MLGTILGAEDGLGRDHRYGQPAIAGGGVRTPGPPGTNGGRRRPSRSTKRRRKRTRTSPAARATSSTPRRSSCWRTTRATPCGPCTADRPSSQHRGTSVPGAVGFQLDEGRMSTSKGKGSRRTKKTVEIPPPPPCTRLTRPHHRLACGFLLQSQCLLCSVSALSARGILDLVACVWKGNLLDVQVERIGLVFN